MKLLLDGLSVLLLCIVAFQDFKQRSISWFLIPFLFIVFTIIAIQSSDIKSILSFLSINIAFVAVQFLFLTFYFSIKRKRWINITNVYLGIGDILFLLILGIAFSPVNFILFYIGSLLLTSLGFGLYVLLRNASNKEIPLAGAMAVVLSICFFYKYWNPDFNFYDDSNGIYLLKLIL